MKRFLSIFLILGMLFCLCSCGEDEQSAISQPKMISGDPAAVGDVFNMPEIEQGSDGAPILADITKQASADDTVIISGKGFGSENLKVFMYAQTLKDNGKTVEAKYTVVDDNLIHVVVDESVKYGIYGIYAQNEAGKSNVKFVNKPKIWYLEFTHVTGGDLVSIYGENLSTKNKNNSNVFLSAEGEYCNAEVIYADPYKVTFKVPYFLESGKKYEVIVHNGHGGKEGFCTAEEKLAFHKDAAVQFKGEKIDVTSFGADGKDSSNDDTEAIRKAIDAASDGDTIYFPKGVYSCSQTIKINKSLSFSGVSSKNSIITTTTDISGYAFDFNVGPVEFKKLGFFHSSKDTKLQSGFINIRGDMSDNGNYSLYIHDCHFEQETSPEYRSKYGCIAFRHLSGVVIEDNTSEATVLIDGRESQKIYVRNNNIVGALYAGPYYGQNTVIFTNIEKMDVSNNVMRGKDLEKDDTGILSTDDMTIGRAVVVQGDGYDLYYGNNTFEASGLPHDNAGELILLENLSYEYEGYVAGFQENTVIIPDNVNYQTSTDHIISIANGEGKYQYRRVTGASGKTITVDRPWDVIPNSKSYVIISNCYYNVAVHNNLFDGYTNYREAPGATCAIQIYGSAHNLFYTNNTMKNLPEGVCITARYVVNTSGRYAALIYWNIFDSNTFEECGDGIRYFMVSGGGRGKIPFHTSVGVSIRRNKFKDTRDYTKEEWINEGGVAINMGQQLYGSGGNKYTIWEGEWIIGVSLENNTFENSEIAGVYFYKHQGKTVLRNNAEDGGELKYQVLDGANGPILAAS